MREDDENANDGGGFDFLPLLFERLNHLNIWV